MVYSEKEMIEIEKYLIEITKEKLIAKIPELKNALIKEKYKSCNEIE